MFDMKLGNSFRVVFHPGQVNRGAGLDQGRTHGMAPGVHIEVFSIDDPPALIPALDVKLKYPVSIRLDPGDIGRIAENRDRRIQGLMPRIHIKTLA